MNSFKVAPRNRSAALVYGALGMLGATCVTAEAAAQPASGRSAAEGPQIDEVVVTARRVAETAQDVPIPVSVIGASKLEADRTFTPESLNNIVPNVKVFKTVTNSNSYAIFIRGVGRDNNFFNVESPIALYVDDVLYPFQVGAVVDLGGVDRVEVLRGPQGTLYGRNATVGAVKYLSRRPNLQSMEASYNLTAGSYDRYEASSSISIPLVDEVLGAKLDLGYHYYGGYMHEIIENKNINGTKGGSGRASLLYRPSSDVEIYVAGDFTIARDEPNIGTAMIVNPLPVRPARGYYRGIHLGPNINNLDAGGLTVQGSWHLGSLNLRSISALRSLKQVYFGDVFSGTNLTPTGVYYNNANDRTFTQEFQATGAAFGDRLKYVSGVFYLDSDTSTLLERPIGFSLTNQNSKSIAVYADGTLDITSRLSISAGGRYTKDKKDVIQTTLRPTIFFSRSAKKSWGATTYRAGANYKISDDILVYASWGEGFKSGQLNSLEPVIPNAAGVFVPPELAENTEVGLKTEWFQRRLRINANYFWTTYRNQTQAIQGPPPESLSILVFADAKITGAELEVVARPTSAWTVSGTLGTLRGKYKNVQAGHPAALSADKTMKHAPRLTYRISTQYVVPAPVVGGELEFGADYDFVDDTWESVLKNPLTFAEATHTLNLHATYVFPGEKYRVIVSGTNVTDEKIFKVVSNPNIRFYSPPSEWSVTLKYNY